MLDPGSTDVDAIDGFVRTVTTDDFVIGTADGAQDLVAVAVRP